MRKTCLTFIALTLVLTFLIPQSGYSSRALTKKRRVSQSKLALVIGNSNYKVSPLKNPLNDARDMARVLKRLGFRVIHKSNADQKSMEKAISAFGRILRKRGGVGLFYYAGHGIQVNGRNYLVPVDANIESESDVRYESVDAGRVLGKMDDAGNDINVIILDACRNNPYAKSFRSADKGLARMDAPRGSIVSYSTAPGSVAADGKGRNGIYTKHLIKYMQKPGLTIEQVMKNVRIAVLNDTNYKQTPWESTSLTGNFYFSGKGYKAPTKPAIALKKTKTVNNRDSFANLLARSKERKAEKVERVKKLINDVLKYRKITKSDIDYETKVSMWEIFTEEYPKWSNGVKNGDYLRLVGKAVGTDIALINIAKEKQLYELEKFTNSIDQKFLLIKPGSFTMGSNSGDDDEKPAHKVTLTEGFYMQTTEVTQKQWRLVMGNNPSSFKGDNLPVEQVSWNDIKKFIEKLNSREGTNKYRLPTEAEWEYSCRAGSTSKYANNNNLDSVGWYNGNSGRKTHEVGQKKANAWGLYDMYGNVWEWCENWKGDYPSRSVTDPVGPSSGTHRIDRGGSWYSEVGFCRSAIRGYYPPESRYRHLGFRLCRTK